MVFNQSVLFEPVRAMAGGVCWAMAIASRRVSWRGNAFVVGEGSRLLPVVYVVR